MQSAARSDFISGLSRHTSGEMGRKLLLTNGLRFFSPGFAGKERGIYATSTRTLVGSIKVLLLTVLGF